MEAYKRRMVDRFGKMPKVGEELLQVVPLRRLGKSLGCERVMLKQGRMFLFFVSATNSPFYDSDTFGQIIEYVTHHVDRCTFREQKGRRSMVVSDVASVQEAVDVLKQIAAHPA